MIFHSGVPDLILRARLSTSHFETGLRTTIRMRRQFLGGRGLTRLNLLQRHLITLGGVHFLTVRTQHILITLIHTLRHTLKIIFYTKIYL